MADLTDENNATRAATSPDPDWSHAMQVVVFQRSADWAETRRAIELPPLTPEAQVPGVAMRAARTMLGLSQSALAKLANSAQVTVNNVENGLFRPSPELAGRLRAALEAGGVRFAADERTLAVLLVSPRAGMAVRSRSPKVNEEEAAFAAPAPLRRGPKPRVPKADV